MRDENIYKEISKGFIRFKDLVSIPVLDSKEEMIDVASCGLYVDHAFSQLPKSSGDTLLLRKDVCKRLCLAQSFLQEVLPNCSLVIVYAYRSLTIQREKFEVMKRELGFGARTDDEAYEQTHHFIAVPEVAGHPTGGAVDLLIIDSSNVPLDFGTGMHEMVKDSYVFSPFISSKAKNNRQILRDIMVNVGFAPYDGEWWHFSYGDREWAAFYNQPYAIYDQLEFNESWVS